MHNGSQAGKWWTGWSLYGLRLVELLEQKMDSKAT